MAGTQILTGGRIEYGNIPMTGGTVSGSTLILNTALPHNLTTGNIVRPQFQGPSLPSQWVPYTAATVSGSELVTISASISGTRLTVTGATQPPIGSYLFYNSLTPGNFVVSGSTPTYTVSVSGTVALTNMVCSPWTVAVTLSGSSVSGTSVSPLPNQLNIATDARIISVSGTEITTSITIANLANSFGLVPGITSGFVMYVPAGVSCGNISGPFAYYVATVSGTATGVFRVSTTRDLTNIVNAGNSSTVTGGGHTIIYPGTLRLCSAGTSTISALNGATGWVTGISGNVLTLGGIFAGFPSTASARPTLGNVNTALIQNPGIQNGGSTSFAGVYVSGPYTVTVISPTSFSIPFTPQTYGGVTYNGPMANFGYLDFTYNATSGQYSVGNTLSQALLTFPANGALMDATTNVSSCFNSTFTTMVMALHFTNNPFGTGTQNSSTFFPTIVSSTVGAEGTAGGINATSGGRDFTVQIGGFAQGTQAGLRHNNALSTFRPGLDGGAGSVGYKICSVMFNSSASAAGDIAANTKNFTTNGWRCDASSGVFAFSSGNFLSAPSGPAITAGTSLLPVRMRLGGDTAITTISGTGSTSYFEYGIAELLVFNTALTLEQRQLVEGYLAQKYACQSTIGGTAVSATSFIHPYRSAATTPSLGLTETNRYMHGLAAWFDASNPGTITLNGTSVSAWASGGGFVSGLSLSQATQLNQPTLVPNALNGLPGVRFVRGTISGSNYPSSSNLSSSLQTYTFNQFTTYATNNEYTWFTVLQFLVSPATNGGVAIVANGGNQYILIENNRIAQQIRQLAPSTTTQVTNYSPSLLVSTPYIIVSTRRGNVLRNIVIGNGARNIASNTLANLSSRDFTVTGYRFTLGGYSATPASNNNPYGGDIYEHIMFRYALTDSQIFQIEGYLAWKWGLQNSLPTTHPYRRVRY
jgi:hypothetical protein